MSIATHLHTIWELEKRGGAGRLAQVTQRRSSGLVVPQVAFMFAATALFVFPACGVPLLAITAGLVATPTKLVPPPSHDGEAGAPRALRLQTSHSHFNVLALSQALLRVPVERCDDPWDLRFRPLRALFHRELGPTVFKPPLQARYLMPDFGTCNQMA